MKYCDAFRPIVSYGLHLAEAVRRGAAPSRDDIAWDLGDLVDAAGHSRRGQADDYAWFAVACWLRERLDAHPLTRDLPVTPELPSEYPRQFYHRLSLLLRPGDGVPPDKALVRIYLLCLDLGFVGECPDRSGYIRAAREALVTPDAVAEDVTVYRRRNRWGRWSGAVRAAVFLLPPLLTGLLYLAYRANLDALYQNIVR